MEVRPGYKQTEIGVIPADWNIKLGEQITTLIGKGASPRWQGFEYTNHGMLFVTSENVRDGFLDVSEPKYLPLAFHEKLKRTKLQPGDILVNLVGASIGRSCQIKADLGDANVNQAVGVFRVKDEYCSEYVACCFQAPTTIERILDMQVDAARPNFSLGDLRRFLIPFPSLPEQRAIATALSDVDALLGALDRLIAKKRDLKQATMQQLLTGQTRLPGFHGEWEIKTLIELADRKKEFFDDGDWIESEHITTEGIRLIQTGNIGVGSFVEKEEKKYINEASFTALRCKQLKQGDLLVCRLADPAGRACVLGDIGEERIVTSVDVTIFRPLSALANRQFLSKVFSTSDWFRAVSDRSGGTTHKRISRGALGRLVIDLPPLAEQFAIAEVLTDMDAELAALEQRRNKTRDLKQAMMQELLTGRVRLTNGEGRIENGE